MTRTTLALVMLSLFAVTTAARQATPVFEAVSIREARSGPASVQMRPHPSGLTAINATALDLIRFAFEVVDADLVGELPGWVRTRRFDVVARSADEALT